MVSTMSDGWKFEQVIILKGRDWGVFCLLFSEMFLLAALRLVLVD